MANDRMPLTNEEKRFIQDNCLSMSDKELAEYLKRDRKTIQKFRNSIGIKKRQGGVLSEAKTPSANLVNSQKMTEKEKSNFFKMQLQNSLYYENLVQQFSKFEINFYLEEWSSLCIQFEDIIATEIRQIDELIKVEIMSNRLLRSIKLAEDEIDRLAQSLTDLDKEQEAAEASTPDEENDAFEQRLELLRAMIRTFSASSTAMTTDYQKLLTSKNNLLAELKARRKDRIEQVNRPGTTFLDVVKSLRDDEQRKIQGRHMELVKIAQDRKMDEWRKPTRFPDGTVDCILLDEHSDIQETDVATMESPKEVVLEETKEEKKEGNES